MIAYKLTQTEITLRGNKGKSNKSQTGSPLGVDSSEL